MKIDLELLRVSTSAMLAYCKDVDMKKSLKKHRNTIDLMIEWQALHREPTSEKEQTPNDDKINQVACDECQQDWNRLEYRDIYKDAFIDGAKWMRKQQPESKPELYTLQEVEDKALDFAKWIGGDDDLKWYKDLWQQYKQSLKDE